MADTTPDDSAGFEGNTNTGKGQTPGDDSADISPGSYRAKPQGQTDRPVTRGDLAYMLSMPQAFAAKSQLAFGQKEAAGGQ